MKLPFFLRHRDKTKQQKRTDNKRLLYPHCVIMRNALCVCMRNQTDRSVWERGCQISRHLIISHLVSGSIKELSDRACKIATITSLCADPIHSPLNTEVWQWLSVVADVSASVDSSDRRRLWRIRLAQQVACQNRPCHLFSPRTSESSTLTCRVSTCMCSVKEKAIKEMGFQHTVAHVKRSIWMHRFNYISVPLVVQNGIAIAFV